jgi:hypothetical protein
MRARWFLPGVLLALGMSVPWYWPSAPPIVAGLPLWVWTTLACSGVLSALTGIAALVAWDDDVDAVESDASAGTEAKPAREPR